MLDRNPALAIPDESYFVPQLARRHPTPVDPAAFADDLPRLPALVVTHHSDVIRQRVLGLFFSPVERLLYTRADLVLSNSESYIGGSSALQRFHHKVRVLPLGLELDAYLQPREPGASDERWRALGQPLWLMVGRLVYYKGLFTALEALRADYEARAAELAQKYAPVVEGLRFGHVGAYGQITNGTFQREFDGSWGTNILNDVGVRYYGQVEEAGPGSGQVSEYVSLEELGDAFREADVITYSVDPDGTPKDSVQQVLDSPLWPNLPAVQAGRTIPIRYTEAATYRSALRTLDAIDEALAQLATPAS